MSTAFSFVFAFVLMLGILIFVHELGHFVAAKLCGVRVLKFSLGFGSPIGFGRYRLKFTRGETEYVAAWVPLGGFVKMLGENPGEEENPDVLADSERAFHKRPVWQRLVILFAGPVMNLVLPILLFTAALAIGVPKEDAIVGTVEPGSPAAAAGLRVGDRIESVGGTAVAFWDEVETAIRARPDERIEIVYQREGAAGRAPLDLTTRAALNLFGESTQVGWSGLVHTRLAAIVGIAVKDAPAVASELRSGDRVLSVDGHAVDDWSAFAVAYAAAAGPEVTLRVSRIAALEPEVTREEREFGVPATGSTDALGVVPASVLIRGVASGTPAERAGLKRGDLLIAIDGTPVGSFGTFLTTIRSSEGRPLAVSYARGGETLDATIQPALVEVDAGMGMKEERYQIGIEAEPAVALGALTTLRVANPLRGASLATTMTWQMTKDYLGGLKRLITGRVSRKQLAGPIGIAQITHQAYLMGWYAYLQTMILISINLGILNLLPIPILDGGQAVLVGIEGLKRSPLSLRTRELALQVGVAMVVVLMGFAFWNDLSRLWSSFIEHFVS